MKYLLFSFNLIFVIAAIALIAVGAYVQIKLTDYYDFFGNDYTGPGIVLIVVGALIFLIAFFGCMGAVKENYCMTMTFAFILGIIFIMMIAGGIAAYVLRNEAEDEVKRILTDAEQNYDSASGVRKAWDKLQTEFSCCGVVSASEWTAYNLTTVYPTSCCNTTTVPGGCDGAASIPASNIYSKGCEAAFVDWVKSKIAIIGGVGVGLAFVMVVGITFSCCLARAIRKEYEVV